MGRRIIIELGNANATAELLEDDAPQTCRAIWERLPLSGQAMPTIVSGSEVFICVGPGFPIGFENQTIYPIPGDVVFYLQPATFVDSVPCGHERHRETIGIAYGRDVQMYGPVLPLPVNVFATIVEGLDAIAAEVGRMKRDGFGSLTLRCQQPVQGE